MILIEVGSGKEFTNIQDAIDSIVTPLTDCYKIRVYDGIYSGFSVSGKLTSLSNYIEIERYIGSTVLINSSIELSCQYVYVVDFDITAPIESKIGASFSAVKKCRIHDFSTDYGVDIFAGVRDFLVDSCYFYSLTDGVRIFGALNNRVQNSVFRNVSGCAIQTVSGIVNPYVINNTIVKCGTGIKYYGDQVIRIRNNCITHNTNGIALNAPLIPDSSQKSNNNVWNNTNNYVDTTGGLNAKSFDPKYVNFAGNDFRLILSSPCIDSGTNIDAPDNDFDQRSRPKNTGFDIGAFEYSTENVAPYIYITGFAQRTDGSGKVDISYTGIDENYNVCHLNLFEYSFTGQFIGEEKEMSIVDTDTSNDNVMSLHFTFSGTEFKMVWDVLKDVGEGKENVPVYIRLRANDGLLDSSIATYDGIIDTSKPIINEFSIVTESELEEDVTVTGIVDLNINVSGNVTSMKFSNDGTTWSHYEPYATSKLGWDLKSGYGGQAFQGLKKIYIKVKDIYGNETDGKLFDSTWYKLTPASVEIVRTGSRYHSIKTAVKNSLDNDTIRVETDDTFFITWQVIKNGLSIVAPSGYSPTIDMQGMSAIEITNVQGALIEGFNFKGAVRDIIRIIDSSNIIIRKNVFNHDYGIYIDPSQNITIEKNIFKDGLKAIESRSTTELKVRNNVFIRISEAAIELGSTISKIVNNTFVDSGKCIENLFPNNDQSIVKNNIFFQSQVGIVANPLWVIEYNNFWKNHENFIGLVPRGRDYRNNPINPALWPIESYPIENAHNIEVDPDFVDYKFENYNLKETSKCVNAGTMVDAASDDFNDVVRKQDLNCDIGAFEFFPIPEYVFNTGNILLNNDIKDVFIYDTKDDSISSQWKKNQFMSWWVEKQNFPEVVFIILTTTEIDIIDASSNSLWMRFSSGANNVIGGASNLKTVFAKNGIIYIGDLANGLVMIDFTADVIKKSTVANSYQYNEKIVNRNSGSGYSNQSWINISANDIKEIKGNIVGEDLFIGIASSNGISIIKNNETVVNYANGVEIDRFQITSNGKCYYIFDENKVGVIYDIGSQIPKSVPDYIYDDAPDISTAPTLLGVKINDIVVREDESGYVDASGVRSNLIHLATIEGLTLIHTNEISPNETEKFGFVKHYGLENSTNQLLHYKVFDGNNSNFHHLAVIDDLIMFVTKENNNDTFYVYNRRSFTLRAIRTNSLPSRNIEVLDCHHIG